MRRIRIALTGTLGVLGRQLASRREGDESCRRVVLPDLAPPPVEFCKARCCRVDLMKRSASARMAEALDRERAARLELGSTPRHSTRETLVEFARAQLSDAA